MFGCKPATVICYLGLSICETCPVRSVALLACDRLASQQVRVPRLLCARLLSRRSAANVDVSVRSYTAIKLRSFPCFVYAEFLTSARVYFLYPRVYSSGRCCRLTVLSMEDGRSHGFLTQYKITLNSRLHCNYHSVV